MAQDQILDGVVIDEPKVKSNPPKNVIDAESLPAAEYDQLRNKGINQGFEAGRLFFTQAGRGEANETVIAIKTHLKQLNVPRRFGGKPEPKDEQALYSIDGNYGYSNNSLEEMRKTLKRARQILKIGAYGILEDHVSMNGFRKSIFENGVKSGWEEVKQKTEFPDEKPANIPWYFK